MNGHNKARLVKKGTGGWMLLGTWVASLLFEARLLGPKTDGPENGFLKRPETRPQFPSVIQRPFYFLSVFIGSLSSIPTGAGFCPSTATRRSFQGPFFCLRGGGSLSWKRNRSNTHNPVNSKMVRARQDNSPATWNLFFPGMLFGPLF